MRKKLKGFFKKYVYDPGDGAEAQVPEEETKSLNIPRLNLTGGTADFSAFAASTTPVGEVDDRFFQQLRVKVSQVPVSEGFRQFTAMIAAMAKTTPDLKARFKIAFDTCHAMHQLSVEQIKTALRDQEHALSAELRDFLTDIDEEAANIRQENQTKVQTAESQIAQTDQQIEELKRQFEQQLQALQTQKSRLESERKAAENELSKIDGDIAATKESFESSHAAMLAGYKKTGWIGIHVMAKTLTEIETTLTTQ